MDIENLKDQRTSEQKQVDDLQQRINYLECEVKAANMTINHLLARIAESRSV